MPRPFFYPDGYCGGSELPDSLDIDRMVYPERPKPVEVEFKITESYEQFDARRAAAENKQEHDNFERDRRLEITIGSATGQNPGPPRSIGKGGK